LRDRTEDIRPLIAHVLGRHPRPVAITDEALRILESHRWPGNIRELQNVVEQMLAMATTDEVGVAELPATVTAGSRREVHPRQDRRTSIADELYQALVQGKCSFWNDVHPLFTNRDLTRADLRQLIRRGLTATGGNYRALLELFGMGRQEYKRWMNFLAAHDCAVDYREFRQMKVDLSDARLNPVRKAIGA
jgi:DNA-binding NtrC family response regulator